jgi:hypothetical protein
MSNGEDLGARTVRKENVDNKPIKIGAFPRGATVASR